MDSLDDVAQLCLMDFATHIKDERQQYGELAEQIHKFNFNLRDIQDYSVVFVVHDFPDKDESGQMFFAPSFPGNQVLQALPGFFGEVLAMRVFHTAEGENYRVLQTQPEADPRYIFKDRNGSLAPIKAPYLGAIFNKIPHKFN